MFKTPLAIHSVLRDGLFLSRFSACGQTLLKGEKRLVISKMFFHVSVQENKCSHLTSR